jgi:hypothetical protein
VSENEIIQKPPSPWYGLLYAPRQAFQQILKRNPYTDAQFWLLFPVCTLAVTLPTWLTLGPGIIGSSHLEQHPIVLVLILLFMLVTNTIILLIATIIFGIMAKWMGGLMGGKSNYRQLYAVLMWANLPFIYMLALWIVPLMLGGKPIAQLYRVADLNQDGIFGYIFLLWTVVLVAIGYSEAHQISLKKGMLLSLVTYGIPILIECVFL